MAGRIPQAALVTAATRSVKFVAIMNWTVDTNVPYANVAAVKIDESDAGRRIADGIVQHLERE